MNHISVIVLCKDNVEEVRDTLNSIALVSHHAIFTVYIIDGSNSPVIHDLLIHGFSDRKFQVVYRNTHKICVFGIYRCMNYALSILPDFGWVVFLNSGDTFYSSLFFMVSALYFNSDAIDVIFGISINLGTAVAWENPNLRVSSPRNWVRYFEPCHQAMFVKTSVAKLYQYDLESPIGADAAWKRKILDIHSFVFVPYPVCLFQLNGASNQYSLSVLRVKLLEPSRTSLQKSFEILKFILFRAGFSVSTLQYLKSLLLSFIF